MFQKINFIFDFQAIWYYFEFHKKKWFKKPVNFSLCLPLKFLIQCNVNALSQSINNWQLLKQNHMLRLNVAVVLVATFFKFPPRLFFFFSKKLVHSVFHSLLNLKELRPSWESACQNLALNDSVSLLKFLVEF